jgi:hypothetical protein
MRYLQIRYANGTTDAVGQIMLDDLLSRNEVAQFYRPSESRWVTVGSDPVRARDAGYVGPERRVTHENDVWPWGEAEHSRYLPESPVPSYPRWIGRFRDIWFRWNAYDDDPRTPPRGIS